MMTNAGGATVIIRLFESADQAAARAVVLAGMRDHWGDAYDESVNVDIDDIATYYAKSRFLVACHGDVLVGTGAVTIQDDGATAIVTRMSTLASHRRKGVARTMLHALIAHAREQRCPRVVLSTNAEWDDAVAFYRACGFEEMRRTEAGVIFVMPLS